MKKVYLLLILISINTIYAKKNEMYQNIIDKLFTALKTQNYEVIYPEISNDMHLNGKDNSRNEQYLKEVFLTYPFEVIKYKLKDYETYPDSTLLHIDYKIEDKGKKIKKSFTIKLDKNNKILDLGFVIFETKEIKTKPSKMVYAEDIWRSNVEIYNNLPIVFALIDNKEVPFLFDTGSEKLILDKRIASSPTGTYVDINGMSIKEQNVPICKFSNFRFGDIYKENFEAPQMDLSELSKDLGIEIYGIIGAELLYEYIIVFDLANKQILGYKTNEEGLPKLELLGYNPNGFPFKMYKHYPMVQAFVHGLTLNFLIDSGLNINLIDEKYKNQLQFYMKPIEDNLKISGIDDETIELRSLSKLKYEKNWYVNMKSSFIDLKNDANKDLQIDGFLGFEFLKVRKICINYKTKKISFIY